MLYLLKQWPRSASHPCCARTPAGNGSSTSKPGTVREALDTLVAQFPALKARVLEGDGVPSFLNVFVDGTTSGS